MGFIEDNLLKPNGDITHHDGNATEEEEELAPSLENLLILTVPGSGFAFPSKTTLRYRITFKNTRYHKTGNISGPGQPTGRSSYEPRR